MAHEEMVAAGKGPMPSVAVEGEDIVSRLPMSYLPCAVENAIDAGELTPGVELEDRDALVAGIVEVLGEESDADGTTALHTLLDQVLVELVSRVRQRGHDYGYGLRLPTKTA
jgi:hypothetical protein